MPQPSILPAALEYGLATGLLEVVVHLIRKLALGRILPFGMDFIWTTPLAHGWIFLILALGIGVGMARALAPRAEGVQRWLRRAVPLVLVVLAVFHLGQDSREMRNLAGVGPFAPISSGTGPRWPD